ncbi:MAG: phosphonate ABC transporter, permease protein PhnE [Pseudomonadota bacterium]|nr:phosphonate ABC transporter, permease protein PhnE [Pseudomonadota bacterium]
MTSSPAAPAISEESIRRIEHSRRLYTGLTLILAIAILVSGYDAASEMNSGGFWSGLAQFFDYPAQIVSQAYDSGWGFFGRVWGFVPALIETLNIAFAATIVASVFGTVFSLLAARNLDVWPPLNPVFRRIMDVMRAFPELIIALFLIFVLGASAVPAAIAVAFHTVGALGKLFSEVIENVDLKPVEGLKSVGASWIQRIRYGVIPQVLPNCTSYVLLRFEINVRASAILGFVGAGGIGSELSRAIGWGSGADTAAIFLLLFGSIVIIDQVSSWLRRRLVQGERH